MKYGLYLPNFGPFGDARRMAGLAAEAEAAGWDGFFIWDHITGEYGGTAPLVDPWVSLAAVAMRTKHIRLGPLVTPLPRRRPWKVAREAVTLDHLSNGRLILGVGIGVGQAEWDHLGEETDLRRRGAMLDEGLAVLTGLWSGEPFSFEGESYQLQAKPFLPVPIQSPRIPIWVGGFWPNKAPFRRAARWDGVFPLFQEEGEIELTLMQEALAYLRQHRTDERPLEVVYVGYPTGTDPQRDAEIVAAYAAVGVTWWLENLTGWRFGADAPQGELLIDALVERVRQGPPAV